MNRNLWLLTICQGLFMTNNVVFIAINGLVGLSLAPFGWMATLPLMAYVVGGAMSTVLVSQTQSRFGRKVSFQLGLAAAMLSALMCCYAAYSKNFWLLVAATVVAGYYNANAQLYRFAAAELAAPGFKEKAISLVMAGGLLGAVLGPNLASQTRSWMAVPFAGAYLALALVALLAMALLASVTFPPAPVKTALNGGRPLAVIMRQPVFIVAAAAGALGYGVMNLLMAATPIAMQICGLPFSDVAWVLEWHVCPWLFYRTFDQALWHAAHHGGWAGAEYCMRFDCAVGRCVSAVCDSLVPARFGLEFLVHFRHHTGHHSLPPRGKRQGARRA